MEVKKYKRQKIGGIILTIIGIVAILFNLFSPYPFPISVVVQVVGIVLLPIGVSFFIYSSRQISSRTPELYAKRFNRQKISGIILTLVGIAIILICVTIYLYYSIKYEATVYWGIIIVWGIIFISLGLGLLGHSVRKIRKETMNKVDES